MAQSIRDIVGEYNNEIYNTDLQPERAAELLGKISSFYGNILDSIKKTEIIYNKVLLGYLDSEKRATHARIKAEITREYEDFRDSVNTEKMALKLMSFLNRFLKMKEEEMRAGRNM